MNRWFIAILVINNQSEEKTPQIRRSLIFEKLNWPLVWVARMRRGHLQCHLSLKSQIDLPYQLWEWGEDTPKSENHLSLKSYIGLLFKSQEQGKDTPKWGDHSSSRHQISLSHTCDTIKVCWYILNIMLTYLVIVTCIVHLCPISLQ